LYVALAGIANAAVRLRICSTMEAQQALRRALHAAPDPLRGSALPAPEDRWGFASPLLEIAVMRHETLAHRLFAS
jgi:urease accessory protein UreF